MQPTSSLCFLLIHPCMAKSLWKRANTLFTLSVTCFPAEVETEGPLGTRQPKVTLGGRTDWLVHY